MARTGKHRNIEFSTECTDAFASLTALAHQLAAVLTGDALSPDGIAETPRSSALTMGMLFFLLRADPNDLEALIFADGSLNQLPFKPGAPGVMREPPLEWLV